MTLSPPTKTAVTRQSLLVYGAGTYQYSNRSETTDLSPIASTYVEHPSLVDLLQSANTQPCKSTCLPNRSVRLRSLEESQNGQLSDRRATMLNLSNILDEALMIPSPDATRFENPATN
jgi:hypothetical protein